MQPFWEKQMHSVIKHKKFDDTFKTVKNALPQSSINIHGFFC